MRAVQGVIYFWMESMHMATYPPVVYVEQKAAGRRLFIEDLGELVKGQQICLVQCIFDVSREILIHVVDQLYREHLHGVDDGTVHPFDLHVRYVIQGEDGYRFLTNKIYLLHLLGFETVGQAVAERFADLEALTAIVLADQLDRCAALGLEALCGSLDDGIHLGIG